MAKVKHTIRIISGSHRSRRLPVLDYAGLRPTGDRVRETLFNWLQMYIADKTVLDLCAGAGSLGFEAASRSAKQVFMIENQLPVVKQLQQIQKDFGFNNIEIKHQSAQDFLANCQQQYDLVFLDPPFTQNLLQQLTQSSLAVVKCGGLIYREATTSQELQKLPTNWKLYRQKFMGQVKIELWQKCTNLEETDYA